VPARMAPDDDVHRFQGRWIEVRGTVLPFFLRYVTWGILIASVLTFIPVFAMLPSFALKDGITWGVVASIFLTYALMAQVDGDRTLRGLLAYCWMDLTGWWQRRTEAAARTLDARPVAYRARLTITTPEHAE
jgi:hypothetical protein